MFKWKIITEDFGDKFFKSLFAVGYQKWDILSYFSTYKIITFKLKENWKYLVN